MTEPLVQSPMAVLTVLLAVLSLLLFAERHPVGERVFRVLPILVLVYFVPTLLSNTGVIPTKSDLYGFVSAYLLPASLVLQVLSMDLPAIARLGRSAVVLFLAGTAGIMLGGPIAYLLLGRFMPAELGEQAWKGLAALSGSWIGGSANFVAIGQSIGTREDVLSMMVVVDVGVSNMWTAVLLYFAGRERQMDERMGADRRAIDVVREQVERFHASVLRPASLSDLVWILTLGLGTTAVCTAIAKHLPDIGTIITGFTWVVILVTTVGVALSFTPLRKLEGAGASRVGALFLYVLVMTIGAKADFRRLLDAPAMVAAARPHLLRGRGLTGQRGRSGLGVRGGGGLPPGARARGRHAGRGRLRAGHLRRAGVRGAAGAGVPAPPLMADGRAGASPATIPGTRAEASSFVRAAWEQTSLDRGERPLCIRCPMPLRTSCWWTRPPRFSDSSDWRSGRWSFVCIGQRPSR
jgi:uncharacterized membrane protein